MLFGLTFHLALVQSKSLNFFSESYKKAPEIHKHNKNTLEKTQQKYPDTQPCNCTNKKQCLFNGQYLTEGIVFQANILANISGYKEKVCLGVSKTTFKVLQPFS